MRQRMVMIHFVFMNNGCKDSKIIKGNIIKSCRLNLFSCAFVFLFHVFGFNAVPLKGRWLLCDSLGRGAIVIELASAIRLPDPTHWPGFV